MLYHKKKTYPGRWILKFIEAALIFAIIFFTVDAIQQAFAPRIIEAVPVVIRDQTQVEVVRIQPPAEPVAVVLSDEEYFYLALDHQMSGEYYDAIADYTRSLEQNPALAPSLLNRGVAYEQLGNDFRAMQDYSRFLNRDGMETITYPRTLSEVQLNLHMVENRLYEFRIHAQAGQTLDVSAVSLAEGVVDPIVVITDENGTPVVARDDVLRQDGSLIAMDSHIEDYQVLRTGYYIVRVSHAGGGSDGVLQVAIATQR